MQNRTLFAIIAACLTTIITASILTHAGPLDPPAGPVTASYKTLTEVEPRTAISAANTPGNASSVFRITSSGSYYLAGNVAGASAKHGILIEASNVTVDLNGFAIVGVGGSLDGINVSGSRSAVSIRNGEIRSCGGSGIAMSGTSQGRITGVVCSNNTLDGVIPGPMALISGVRVADNARDGFSLGAAVASVLSDCIAHSNNVGYFNPTGDILFERCIARQNRSDGFQSAAGNRMVHCTSTINTGWGFRSTGERALFESCNAESNVQGGFKIASFDNVVTRCTARGNNGVSTASGFMVAGGDNTDFIECVSIFNGKSGFELAGGRPTLRNCSALDNPVTGIDAPNVTAKLFDCRSEGSATGMDLGGGSVVEQCTVRLCGGDGIRINGNGNAVIRRTQAISNGGNGMVVRNGTVIEDCLVSGNTLFGVNGGTLSIVRRSTFDTNGLASGNSHANIFCNGGGNLIEDNYIFNGDSAIVLTFGGGSIVRRNIANGTANNYGLIVGGNRVAPINTSATLTTTNPNDNFSY